MTQDMSLAAMVQQWRQEAIVRSNNENAARLRDKINAESLRDELRNYLAMLYNDPGQYSVQYERAEGPESLPALLHANERIKQYKARIRAIGLDTNDYLVTVNSMIDLIKKTLQLKPEYAFLSSAEKRETVLKLVAQELFDLKDILDSIKTRAVDVGQEYNDRMRADSLTYNIVNAMSYHRGLYNAQSGPGTNPTRHY